MAKHDAFFDVNKKSAAILKHAILRKYLAVFAARLGSTLVGHRVGFVDGYAGPGNYVNIRTGTVSEGSPQIALKIATGLLATGRKLDCVFVEKDPAIFSRLNALVSTAHTPAVAWKGDIAHHLQQAMARLDGVPTLVFLDPFGATVDVDMTINTILKRPGMVTTELLLNFSLDALRRIGGRLFEDDAAPGRTKALERADGWLGGPWWRQHFFDAASTEDNDFIDNAATAVAREYNKRIQRATGCSTFSVPIRRRAHHKPIFFLTLFFPRNLAGYAYNEAVSLALQEWRKIMGELDVDDAARRQEKEGFVLGEPSPEELTQILQAAAVQFDADVIADIKENLRQQFVEHASLSVESQVKLVLGRSLGAGREKHLRAAWNQLYAEGVTAGKAPSGKLDRVIIQRRTAPVFR
ncbi:three-Cys-motif partner protein TcmP [Frondihabitans sp. 4ASC-45]|uniref:three-Cys-motif partner protein TcmP n=1 Tax=Frondihabitans sp. 4ASC-45 TaxID=3111636 RepID=UPI003C1E9D00